MLDSCHIAVLMSGGNSRALGAGTVRLVFEGRIARVEGDQKRTSMSAFSMREFSSRYAWLVKSAWHNQRLRHSVYRRTVRRSSENWGGFVTARHSLLMDIGTSLEAKMPWLAHCQYALYFGR
jgi:hypothetical protein